MNPLINPLGIPYVLVDGRPAMAKTKDTLMLSVFRKCLYAAGGVVLPMRFTAEAAFYTEPLADIVSAIVTTTVFLLVINKHLKMRQAAVV